MPSPQNPGPSLSRDAGDTTVSPPAGTDRGDNSASTITEAPQARRGNPLDAHDFPSGGGGGGAQAFSARR